MAADLAVRSAWAPDADELLAWMRRVVHFGNGDLRATGDLTGRPELAATIARLRAQEGVEATVCAYQAYRDGAAEAAWHADDPFEQQAILSVGATRTLRTRPAGDGGDGDGTPMPHGTLVVMPAGYQADHEHAVLSEPAVRGDRYALVFRTPRRD